MSKFVSTIDNLSWLQQVCVSGFIFPTDKSLIYGHPYKFLCVSFVLASSRDAPPHQSQFSPSLLPKLSYLYSPPTHSPTRFPLTINFQYIFYFFSLVRFKHLSLGLPCYSASFGLWIVAWAFSTLWLLCAYEKKKTYHGYLLGLWLHQSGYFLFPFIYQQNPWI